MKMRKSFKHQLIPLHLHHIHTTSPSHSLRRAFTASNKWCFFGTRPDTNTKQKKLCLPHLSGDGKETVPWWKWKWIFLSKDFHSVGFRFPSSTVETRKGRPVVGSLSVNGRQTDWKLSAYRYVLRKVLLESDEGYVWTLRGCPFQMIIIYNNGVNYIISVY